MSASYVIITPGCKVSFYGGFPSPEAALRAWHSDLRTDDSLTAEVYVCDALGEYHVAQETTVTRLGYGNLPRDTPPSAKITAPEGPARKAAAQPLTTSGSHNITPVESSQGCEECMAGTPRWRVT